MKKLLGIVGISLVAGTVFYVLLNQNKKRKEDNLNQNTELSNENFSEKDKSETDNETDVYSVYEEEKNAVANVVHERHIQASEVMKDAVGVICKNAEVSQEEVSELEEISSGLEDLLSGE